MTREQLHRFAELVAETGRVVVAPDVYKALQKAAADLDCTCLAAVEVSVCEDLPPGSALAARPPWSFWSSPGGTLSDFTSRL